VAGGPSGQVPIEWFGNDTATYTCSHVLTLADANHEYENSATVTASGEGAGPITHTSNTVIAKVPFTGAPAFTMEKTQHVAGQEGTFTIEPVSAVVGETIEYEVLVTNTGNVPLTFSSFTDAVCDGGTITGGPAGAVEPGASTTYKCTHLVTIADEEAGGVANVAEDTGTPPAGLGSAVTHESNAVTASILFTPRPGLQITKKQRDGGTEYTSAQIEAPRESLIEYLIEVKNTGNVTLTLSNFVDAGCDEGSLITEPGEAVLAPHQTRIYECSRRLTQSDQFGELIDNLASETGTPPEGQGAPVEATSNTVVAEVTEL
jgi:uncharacterized repeat protein (TIGR01451 family)